MNISRRTFLISSAALGTVALKGCANIGEGLPLHGFLPEAGSDFGGEARAREIFSQIDRGLPVSTYKDGSGAEKERLLRRYVSAKSTVTGLLDGGRPVTFGTLVEVMGEPVVGIVREGTRAAALKDLTSTKAKRPTGTQKVTKTNSRFTIPHGRMLFFNQKGFCMDPNLPAPGRGDAFVLRRASERVPEELMPLYRAMGEAAGTDKSLNHQGMLWTLMGAGSGSNFARAVDTRTLQNFDRVLPGGADLFRSYVNKTKGVRAMVNLALQVTGLDQYFDAADLMSPHAREAAVSNHLRSLIDAGRNMSEGKGAGYTMLADGVAAVVTGGGTLQPTIRIANVSGEPFVYDLLDWYAKPLARKQSVSGTDDVSGIREGPIKTTDAPIGKAPDQGSFPGGFLEGVGPSGLPPIDGISTEEVMRLPGDEFAKAFAKDLTKFVAEKGLGWVGDKTPSSQRATGRITKDGAILYDVPPANRRTALKAFEVAMAGAPAVGNLLSGYEAISGRNWLTGEDLTAGERVLSAIGMVPGLNTLKALAKGAKVGLVSDLFEMASKTALPKFVDKTEALRDVLGWVESDSARYAVEMVNADAGRAFHEYGDASKAVSRAIYQSRKELPWSEPARTHLDSMGSSMGSIGSNVGSSIANFFKSP